MTSSKFCAYVIIYKRLITRQSSNRDVTYVDPFGQPRPILTSRGRNTLGRCEVTIGITYSCALPAKQQIAHEFQPRCRLAAQEYHSAGGSYASARLGHISGRC